MVRGRGFGATEVLRGTAQALAVVLLLVAFGSWTGVRAQAVEEDERTAAMLAGMLHAVRAVIAHHQPLINDPGIGPKGLTGEVILAETLDAYRAATGQDPDTLETGSRDARLMAAMRESIREVVDEHRGTIDAEQVGFKGFIPAVVGRLVSERFGAKAGAEALVRITAPPQLVRNRRALPDAWEATIIESHLTADDWPEGEAFIAVETVHGREAFRILVPEYYSSGCLTCHGEPRGEIDLTGYPKEGGRLGQLGAVISITLFR